tara:strand:+ start:1171 stop:1545 length:375 start_codon:yes stop_codon:yes gene_type:complete
MLPIDIKLHQKSKRLELSFTDSRIYSFSYEFLRVHSPSAEVRGHSPSQAVLQLDKVSVGVKEVELVGAYALKITFDDGHNTGLYTWDYFRELHDNKEQYWNNYLQKLIDMGHDRELWLRNASSV